MNVNTSKTHKKCPRCGIVKNRETDFYQIKGESIKVNGLCKPCLLERNAEKRRSVKEQAVKYLGGKCSVCGYDKCLGALEFHHLDPSQKDPTYHSYKTIFNDRFKKELDKCILLCANCHKELHFNEGTFGKH